jgi:hypothetical protein
MKFQLYDTFGMVIPMIDFINMRITRKGNIKMVYVNDSPSQYQEDHIIISISDTNHVKLQIDPENDDPLEYGDILKLEPTKEERALLIKAIKLEILDKQREISDLLNVLNKFE